AVTPEIRANVGTTVALRVASESESRDLIGTADAATLPRSSPGRAIIVHPAGREEVQVALPIATPTPRVQLADCVDANDGQSLEHVARERWSGHQRVAPLWQPPLPTDLECEAPKGHHAIAVCDW